MTKKYLLDTCVWRDFYEKRFSRSGNNLGRYARVIFMKIIKNKDQILFSEALTKELSRDYDENDINDMLNLLFVNRILIKINITKKEYLESVKLSQMRKVPFVDCLNAVQARNHKAIMVTQDRHFFESLNDITKAVHPQDVI